MASRTLSPIRMAQAAYTSSQINTGEFSFVRGGQQSQAIFSGALAPSLAGTDTTLTNSGPDLLLVSGACRLNSLLVHTQMQSGLSMVFYDAAVVTSGGPFALSGHKIVGATLPTWPPNGPPDNGTLFPNPFATEPMHMDVPVFNGLCVALKSGQPGVTATYTLGVTF